MPPKAPGSQLAPDRPLVRLATTTPWEANVFVVPLTPPRNEVLRKDLGETVAVWVQGIGWADRRQPRARRRMGSGKTVTEPDATKLYRTFALVPDGVTKIAIYPHAKLGRPADHGPLVTATVHNHIAVFQTTGPGPGPLLGYWYGPDDRIIKRFGFNQPEHLTPPPVSSTPAKVLDSLRTSFAAFQRPRTLNDAVPSTLKSAVTDGSGPRAGLEFDQSRLVISSRSIKA
jgi:hypothetical protein